MNQQRLIDQFADYNDPVTPEYKFFEIYFVAPYGVQPSWGNGGPRCHCAAWKMILRVTKAAHATNYQPGAVERT